MNLEPPDQLFATTLYDRHQPQQLSFVFIPTRSLANRFVPELSVIKDLIDPNANFLRTIAPSYLPAASFAAIAPSDVKPVFVGRHTAASGVCIRRIQQHRLRGIRSLFRSGAFRRVSFTIEISYDVGRSHRREYWSHSRWSHSVRPSTVPAGIILCTAAVIFGPALGEKVSKLIGA